MDLNRAKGAVFGAATGDALGAPLEFSRPHRTVAFPTLMTGPLTSMTGGGCWAVAPGQITDDTHMATCLANALADGYDVDKCAARYAEWLGHTFDAGGLTRRSLGDVRSSGKGLWAGYKAWGGKSAGNGSLMRTSPIGAFVRSPKERRQLSMIDSAITHFDPRCQIGCAAYNAAIGAAVFQGADAEKMWQAALTEVYAATASFLSNFPQLADHAVDAAADLTNDLYAARSDDPSLYGEDDPDVDITGSGSGFVRTGFRLAFWELMHTKSYSEAVIDTVNRGGDTDTNGAITGGLVGALYGFDSIPADWTAAVQSALQDTEPGGKIGHRSPMLRDLYHPKQFDRMLTALSAREQADADRKGQVEQGVVG